MSAKRIVQFLGDYEVPAGWAFAIEFVRRPAASIAGRSIGVFGVNEGDADDTITTSDVTVTRTDDAAGVFTVTFPGTLTADLVGKRFKITIGFTSGNDCSGELTMRPYAAGR